MQTERLSKRETYTAIEKFPLVRFDWGVKSEKN